MGFHKAQKFPFEVTRGKSRELFQLRFMRKSELEPNLRHNFRLNICQMGRQLDMWFKEQIYTIGSLNKEQEKIYQSRRRLRREIRQSKKREYGRRQEEIREKLQNIKINMMAMKVIHKWRDNLRLSKLEKEAEQAEIRNAIREVGLNNVHAQPDFENTRTPGDNSKTFNTKISSPRLKKYETNIENEVPIEDQEDSDTDSRPDVDEYTADDEDSLYGTRYPSSKGPRMETIPEETNETELEIDDHRALPRLTKQRLKLLNRSHSSRNVFDGNDSVPLLPEVGAHNQVTQPVPPDTADKETQTSEKLEPPQKSRKKESHLRRKMKNSKTNDVPKMKIVVKLPGTPNYKSRDKSQDSSSHNQGEMYLGDSDSDEDYCDNFVFTNQNEDSDEYDDNDEITTTHLIPLSDGYPRTLMKYNTTHRNKSNKNMDHTTFLQNVPTVNNIEPNLPPASPLGCHSPFPVHNRERSFHFKPNLNDHLTGCSSAKSRSKGVMSDQQNKSPRNGYDGVKHKSSWRSTDDMRQKLEAESQPHMSARPNIAIFGRKTNSMAESMTPPNSPRPNSTYQTGLKGTVRNPRPHTNVLYTHKRAKATEQKKIHDVVVQEPVQQYERTRSGRIKPFGTPRAPDLEFKVPSFKDQYYRDKLLKTERDSIFKQNIKMKRFMNFMDAFKTERNSTILPSITRNSISESETDEAAVEHKPKRTIGSLFFKVEQTDQASSQARKVIPGPSTTSLRLLKDCRYLRQYKPMSVEEKLSLYPYKESSWNMQNSSNYFADVRVD